MVKYFDCYHEIGVRMCAGEDMTEKRMQQIKGKWTRRIEKRESKTI